MIRLPFWVWFKTSNKYSTPSICKIARKEVVYDLSGKLVKTINPQAITKVNISDLSSGIYVLRMRIDSKSISKKLIVHDSE